MAAKDTIMKGMSALCLVLFSLTTAYAQQSVEGIVSDQNGKPLPGVNIQVKGTTQGTSTDAQGSYSLGVESETDTLVFSFIGFQTQEIAVQGRAEINVSMIPQAVESGEELVVVGYGTQQRSDLTGSISSVDSEDISNVPTSNMQDALQGKVSGIQISPSSGSPGSQPTVRIRGVGTLNNASPLYVVDGMLLSDISYLNPSDIESIQVLKDASATAIYGSRGANGVVIVTTKSGQSGEANISISSYFGAQLVGDRIQMVNANEYATLVNESQQNMGDSPIFSNPEQYGTGTNWQDVIFEGMAPQQNYQITASGGTDNFTYNVSANYFKQQGVVKGSDYQRVSLRVNNEYFLSDNAKLGHNIALTYRDSTDETGDIINQALRADPTISPRNEGGEFSNSTANGGSTNPAASIAYNNNNNFGFRTVGNVYLEIDFLEHFNFRSSFGLDLDRNEEKAFTPEYFVSPIQQAEQSELNVTNTKTTNWLNENTLKYQRDLGDHSFDLLGGITFQKNRFENLGGSRINILGSAPEFWYLDAGATDGQTNFNSSQAWGMVSYLFRANYNYKDRYLFTGTYRIDGSSRFATDNRYGYFPSIALGWRISNEPFLQDVSYLSNLKLRASWGIIGNDKIDPYGTYATIASNINAVFGEEENLQTGSTQNVLGNSALQWEESEQLDIGLEMGFLENRLTAQLDWYRKKTDRILIRVPIPGYIGVSESPFSNAASVLNRGFDLSLNWQDSGEDFSYSIGLTGSKVHNEVLSLGGGKEEILGGNVGQMGGFTTRTVPGQPIGSFYGWKANGIFQTEQEVQSSPTRGGEQPGDIKIADINGDGTISDADKTFLGSPIPDYIIGLNLSGSYKQFDLAMSFDSQVGNQVLYARKAIRGFRLLNYEESYLDRWTGAGSTNSEPRITESGHNYEVVDRFLQDGDFVRLRNVQLGYTLPTSALNTLKFKNIRVYANAKNLFTLTDYVGYNPQIGGGQVTETGIDRGTYPIPSIYTLGIELSF
jgi:TonB-linked SusC/RagA family outer membrane protein